MNKNIGKSTIYALLIAVVFLNITIDAHAQELQNRNSLTSQIDQNVFTDLQNTGNDTAVSSDTNTEQTTHIDNTNNADIQQNVNAEANTGYNVAERNISIGGNAGMITTGDAGVLTTAHIQGNENTSQGSGGTSAPHTYNSLANTGNSLNTHSSNDATTMTAVQSNNKTTVSQNVNATANTGGNYAPRNISIGGQSGVIDTGNAYTSTNMLIAGNGNVALIGGESNGNGPGSGASVVLLNNGDRARTNNSTSNENRIDVSNLNLMSVRQQCGVLTSCIADTGHNTSNRNINPNGDAGVIQTGNAMIGLSVGLRGNSNATAANQQGVGGAQLTSGINSGNDVSLNNTSTSKNTTNVHNTNNATVAQDVNAKANTGYNEANRNIAFGGDAGVIQAGSAYVVSYLSALVNSNN